MDQYTLPDGRQPIRFDKGRAAFYFKVHGEGEVRYMFSMIKHIKKNRPLKSDAERSRIAKENAEKLMANNPNYFKEIGSVGGKHGRKNSEI